MVDEQQPLTFQVKWKVESIPRPVPVNQMLIVTGSNTSLGTPSREMLLDFGLINAPIFIENEATGQREVLGVVDGNVLPVEPVARLSLTWDRLVEFSSQLNTFVEQNRNAYGPHSAE